MENKEDKELNPAKTLPIYSAVRKLVYITDDVMHEMDRVLTKYKKRKNDLQHIYKRRFQRNRTI